MSILAPVADCFPEGHEGETVPESLSCEAQNSVEVVCAVHRFDMPQRYHRNCYISINEIGEVAALERFLETADEQIRGKPVVVEMNRSATGDFR